MGQFEFNGKGRTMSIKARIATMATVLIVALLGVVWLGRAGLIESLSTVAFLSEGAFGALIDKEVQPLINETVLPLINEDFKTVTDCEESIRVMLEADRDVHQAMIAERLALDSTSAQLDEADKANVENIGQARTRMEKASVAFTTPEAKDIYAKFVPAFDKWEKMTRGILDTCKSGAALEAARASSFSGEASTAFSEMREFINSLTEIQEKIITANLESVEAKRKVVSEKSVALQAQRAEVFKAAGDAMKRMNSLGRTFLLVGWLAALIGGFMAFLFARTIVKSLAEATQFMADVAQGRLNLRLTTGRKDETGLLADAINKYIDHIKNLANEMDSIARGDLTHEYAKKSDSDEITPVLMNLADGLRQLVVSVNEVAIRVDNGSRQVAESSQYLSDGATQQAASLQEISSTMTEIGAQTRTNAESANKANSVVLETRDSVAGCNRQMSEMNDAMIQLRTAAKQIANIIKVIDDIAFQTNLLALNAAVEAARAGRHGKGFAVVADEVRNLASRSAKAAKETADLIESVVARVQAGGEMADNSAKALASVSEKVSVVTELVSQIAEACNEQAQGIGQVNIALAQIDQVTQQNTANAEETSAAAQELSGLSRELRGLLEQFKIAGINTGDVADVAVRRPQLARRPAGLLR